MSLRKLVDIERLKHMRRVASGMLPEALRRGMKAFVFKSLDVCDVDGAKRRSALVRMVSGKRVAVIGPSPSLFRASQVEKLEAYDLVVRLNKAVPVRENVQEVTGSRTDILVHNLRVKEAEAFGAEALPQPELWREHGVKCVLGSMPKWSTEGYQAATSFLRSDHQPMHVAWPSLKQVSMWSKGIGVRPTTGLVAILWMLEAQAAEVYVTGLTFMRDGYQADYNRSITDIEKARAFHRDQGVHDPDLEFAYFVRHVADDPRITYDDPLRECIEQAESEP